MSLGERYWVDRPGVVQVAVRWQRPGELVGESSGRLLGLWVTDRNGKVLAAGSEDPNDLATAQAIDAGELEDGDYEVFVAPLRDSQVTEYDVSVSVQERPSTVDARPDLATFQPANLSFDLSGRTSGRRSERSCHDSEIATKPGLDRCLRFDATIANRGTAAFVVEADIRDVVKAGFEPGAEPSGQAIHVLPDGSRRRTGRWVIDREHVHVHMEDLVAYELHAVSPDGERDLLLTDEKIGFCPWDLTNERFGRRGNTERTYRPSACDVPEATEEESDSVRVLGISPGWADVYPADRNAQFLDASDLRDGTYDVVIRVDPADTFEELDETNNDETTRIRIAGDRITCLPDPYGCPPRAVG